MSYFRLGFSSPPRFKRRWWLSQNIKIKSMFTNLISRPRVTTAMLSKNLSYSSHRAYSTNVRSNNNPIIQHDATFKTQEMTIQYSFPTLARSFDSFNSGIDGKPRSDIFVNVTSIEQTETFIEIFADVYINNISFDRDILYIRLGSLIASIYFTKTLKTIVITPTVIKYPYLNNKIFAQFISKLFKQSNLQLTDIKHINLINPKVGYISSYNHENFVMDETYNILNDLSKHIDIHFYHLKGSPLDRYITKDEYSSDETFDFAVRYFTAPDLTNELYKFIQIDIQTKAITPANLIESIHVFFNGKKEDMASNDRSLSYQTSSVMLNLPKNCSIDKQYILNANYDKPRSVALVTSKNKNGSYHIGIVSTYA